MNPKIKTALSLLTVFLVLILVYWMYGIGVKDNGLLREENEKIKDSISQIKMENEILLFEVKKRDIEVDSLKSKLEKNQDEYKNIIYKYEKLKKDFKALPESSRDSILLYYIRANQ